MKSNEAVRITASVHIMVKMKRCQNLFSPTCHYPVFTTHFPLHPCRIPT